MKWPGNVAHMDEKRDTARYSGAKFPKKEIISKT